jgi:hypothetical protein
MTPPFSNLRTQVAAYGLALSLSAGAFVCMATPAMAAPELLGNFETWDAYKSKEAQGVVCYVVAEPQTKLPAAAKRDPIFMVINTWPGHKVKHQPNIQIGYPFKEGSAATAQIGSDKFSFFTVADSAWLKTAEEETNFLNAMRQGSELQVQGTSRRGTLTTDTYALKGVSAALDKAAAACN